MRVAGGELRGRKLRTPNGGAVRPTTERVREAVFSIIGPAGVEGARVLDLFCGTGALGIEALSRGAASAVLVDKQPAAAETNVVELGLGDAVQVVRADVVRFLASEQGEFDLVFLDPPYRIADRPDADLDSLIPGRLAAGAVVIAESSPEAPLALSLPLRVERRYGETLIRVHDAGVSP